MSIAKFIKHEAKELLIVTLFFLSGFLLIFGLFELMLEDYGIHFNAWVKAVVGALVLAKVVLILRGRAFMQVFPNYYGIVRVLYKTIIYLVGVFVILTLERVVEAYGDAGGGSSSFEARRGDSQDLSRHGRNSVGRRSPYGVQLLGRAVAGGGTRKSSRRVSSQGEFYPVKEARSPFDSWMMALGAKSRPAPFPPDHIRC